MRQNMITKKKCHDENFTSFLLAKFFEMDDMKKTKKNHK